jgi:hypothetical protein
MADDAAPTPTHVSLNHPVFVRVEGISFRRSATDGAPVMVMPFGEREAAIPLGSLRTEFEIDDHTPDGRMLSLVAEALGYVTALAPGDALPPEVTCGQASWTPSVLHRHRADRRLRVALLRWWRPAAVQEAGGEIRCWERIDQDPELRSQMGSAYRRTAETLGLDGPGSVEVRIAQLAEEFAFIEALRDELLDRVERMAGRCRQYESANPRLDARRRDTIVRMRTLLTTALGELQQRFQALDGLLDDITGLLADPDSQVESIRSYRNALHRARLGWQEVLDQWSALDVNDEAGLWGAILDTYQFLAKRYLPYTEWPTVNSLRGPPGKGAPGMRW